MIRGVLFDSGGVVIRPVGGRWNPRYDFESIVVSHHPDVRTDLFPQAIDVGQRYLDTAPTTADRSDYHRAMLTVLKITEPSAALLDELEAKAKGPVVEPYPDARPVLERLAAEGIGMSVVSDSWAGLDDLYRELDLERYFAGFVISEVLGCRKPDPRMYAAGRELLGLRPDECLFIDDDPELVEAAIALGYHGVALLRDNPTGATGATHPRVPVIRSLDELPAVVNRPY